MYKESHIKVPVHKLVLFFNVLTRIPTVSVPTFSATYVYNISMKVVKWQKNMP